VANTALIVHGGAWDIPTHLRQICKNGVQRALDRGFAILERGGSALDACEQAIIELEDEPVFDAGIGSHLNRDGKIQLDAILMDGPTLKSGAVVAVERVRHPILLARAVLEKSEHMLLAGYGAEQFALEHGVPLCDPKELITDEELAEWGLRSREVANLGTVGAVALDSQGKIASGTSTGGTPHKYPGRVGDSALVGCGCYASEAAGISSTGHGESIMKVVLAKTVHDFIAEGAQVQLAAEDAVALLTRLTGGRGGLIALDREGRPGFAFSTGNMAYAYRRIYGSVTVSGIFDTGL
jgi:beta-aspartyl-peptidase (threonine type)